MTVHRGFLLLFALVFVVGCDGKTIPFDKVITPTPTPIAIGTPSPSPSSSAVAGACEVGATVATIGATGGTVATAAGSGMLTETFAANQLASNTTVSLGYIPSTGLSAPLSLRGRQVSAVRRAPMFTAGAGNTYIAAFCTSFTGGTPSSGIALSGTGIVPTTIAVGTQLNIALYNGTTYVDVGTTTVTASGSFASTATTVALPGITQTGSYLLYQPAAGTNTAQINFGFALIADDGTGSLDHGFQYVQVEDPNNNAIPTPTTTYFPVGSAAQDLDGQSLTPDASHGASVDGGNSVYFFTGIPQHTFTIAPQTVDVSAYGGDGDAIASLPSGDQVVVSANGTQLAVLSGINSSTPVVSDTITNPASTYDRDGLVISTDGTVMLSRGYSGLDVYKVSQVAAHAGSTGTGTTSFGFALTGTFSSSSTPAIATPAFEDGRDGMAISPVDASRALVVGNASGGGPVVQLLTGLTSATPTLQSVVRAQFVPVARRVGAIYRRPEASAHRLPQAVTPSVGSTLYAVTITPDGSTAFVSTDAGILTFSGVATGSLAQVGAAYSPAITVPAGSCPLVSAPSIGVTPDGKYLIAVIECGFLTPGTTDATQGQGVIVTIPIGAGGALGTPVGQLNNVVTPFNDQIIFH